MLSHSQSSICSAEVLFDVSERCHFSTFSYVHGGHTMLNYTNYTVPVNALLNT